MTNYREILRIHSLGLNKTEIASSCQCARNTVAATLQRAANCGLQWPLPEGMSDKQLSEQLFPSSAAKPVYKMPDYAYVHKELQRSGVTLNLLWLEYCDQCRAAGEIPYQSTQFNKYYADYLAKANATMHLNHKPGEVMQVDWAGDTAAVIDTDTGEVIPAYVFVATLPYSGYSYVEAFFSMNQESWTTAHVNAYKYFGGVTRIIQCDNLKTGVQKHGKDEVVLNKSYQELAEHYGTAILPARVRSPKDKAAVEGTVGIISTFILAALRNRQFLSLSELNDAIWDRLEAFNHKPFQKREGSRASNFAEEKPFLRPLPPRPFELATWKVATVGPNYHISVERMNYSVPFAYIKQKVDIRLTRATVEVFYGGNRICSHPRLYGRFNQYSTIQEHMPPEHQKYVQWNGERFIHARDFLSQLHPTEIEPMNTVDPFESQIPNTETIPTREYQQLWDAMQRYNMDIYEQGQSGLNSSLAYEEPSFLLKDYGLETEMFGVISIPAIDVELPLYLGATEPHLADGAAHLSQTSLPIGGINTNSVIAGHRGYSGAAYFRFVNELQPGDLVIITNPWETLTYVVSETQIISPNDVDAIHIQPNRDLLTLLTCHPYASGGKQRYLVICERKSNE